jgi:chromosome segregation ATPase
MSNDDKRDAWDLVRDESVDQEGSSVNNTATNETPTNVEPLEDNLLVQIDAFRDKAKQLQGLINAKQNRVRELEGLVAEKEEQNQKLQDELTKKQEEADGLVTSVETQVDRMLKSLRGNMDDFNDNVAKQVNTSQEEAKKQSASIQESVDKINDSLETLKNEIGARIHSENVKVYRNVQDLFKEQEEKMTAEDVAYRVEMEQKYRSMKIRFGVALTLLIISIAVQVVTALTVMGIL